MADCILSTYLNTRIRAINFLKCNTKYFETDIHTEHILNKIQASDFRHGNCYLSLCECMDFIRFCHDFFAALNCVDCYITMQQQAVEVLGRG